MTNQCLLMTPCRLPLLVLLLLLTACGGSGGAADKPPTANNRSVVLSGTIFIPGAHVVDNDVNDPQGQNGPRNNPEDSAALPGNIVPQLLTPNPVAIIGYVNRPFMGADGESWAAGDVDDYYRVSLRAGQIITLNHLGSDSDDLDLHLYNASGDTLIDSSAGLSGQEQLQVTEDGDYVVDVFAFSGASNYVLSIGLSAQASLYTAVNLRHDFVPGEVLVASKRQLESAGSSFDTFVRETGAVEDGVERWLLPHSAEEAVTAGFPVTARPQYLDSDGYQDKINMVPMELRRKWHTLMHLKELSRREDVLEAMPNARVRASALPDDPRYVDQWHYPLINLPQAWDITTGEREGGEVIVAVVDSGVLLEHPDLQGQLVDGYDFVSNVANAGDGDGRDPYPEDEKVSGHHGTHVAGTIAAASNNGRGVAGVAWQAKIMPLRAIGLYGGSIADVLEAVKFAAGLPNASGRVPEQRADIINLSLGSANDACLRLPLDPIAQQVFNQVRRAGVIVVAAAGNERCGQPSYPAGFDGVVSVSAVALDRTRASYSNYGSTIDIAAPGGGITDLDGNGASDFVISTLGYRLAGDTQFRYGGLLGTSMATPHVSGVVALMKAVSGELTPAQLDNLIRAGQITEDLGPTGRDDFFGYGLVDAYRAVLAAGGTEQLLEPELLISPVALNFGDVQTVLPLTLSNQGGGDVIIESIVADVPWLTIAPSAADDGLGGYRIMAERAELKDGNYFASLTVDSSLGLYRVSVAMTVARSAAQESDAGRHYVLLIDTVSNSVVDSIAVDSEGGRYRYQFTGVESGREYVIVAGTDLDNDLLVCSGADACGAYPLWSEPQPIAVGADSVSGLDFTTSYLVPLISAGKAEAFSMSEQRSLLIPVELERGGTRQVGRLH